MSSEAANPSRKRQEIVVLRDKGVITLPQQIRLAVDLDVGDQMIVTVDDGRVVLTPARVVPRDHPGVPIEDRPLQPDPDTDKAAGRLERFMDDESFLESLAKPGTPKSATPQDEGPGYGFGPNVQLLSTLPDTIKTAPTAPVKTTGRTTPATLGQPGHVFTGREQTLPFVEGEPQDGQASSLQQEVHLP